MRHATTKEKFLGTIIVAQGLVILAQVTGVGAPRPAHADVQLQNPSERQMEMIDELKGVNARLDKVLSVMQGGEFQVRVAKSDDAAAPKPDDGK
jgi:hypothetical protein